MMDEKRLLSRSRRRRQVSERTPSWTDRAVDPVVGILLLAGLFDGMSGNPIHGLVLAGAGGGLIAIPPGAGEAVVAPPGRDPKRRRREHQWTIVLPIAVAFGVVSGGLERYTWPVTFAILVPGITVLVVASRTRWTEAPSERLDPRGVTLWIGALLALGIFELANFVLQPSRLEGSFDHPTLSTLFDEVVVGHPSRAIALCIWLLAGWWLVER